MLNAAPLNSVPPNDTARVLSVLVVPGSVNIDVAVTSRLTATVLTFGLVSAAVTWASATPSVATVDATGLVTGQAVGATTVTATAAQDPTKVGAASVRVGVNLALTLLLGRAHYAAAS